MYFWFLLWIMMMSDFERYIFCTNGESLFLSVQKVDGGRIFFLKKLVVSSFSVRFVQKIFTHRKRTFQQSSRICVVRIQMVFEEKFLEKKLLQLFFWPWAERFQFFSNFFFDMHFIKLFSHFWSKILVAKIVRKRERSLIFFRYPSGKISHLGPHCWSSVFQTAFSYTYPEKSFGGTWIQQVWFYTFIRSVSGNILYYEWKLLAVSWKPHPTFIEDK